jgi:hypothetical protein
MADEICVGPAAELPPGTIKGAGRFAVGNAAGKRFAVTRRCRHLRADLAAGSTPKTAWSARGTGPATTSTPAGWSRGRVAPSPRSRVSTPRTSS